MQDSVSGFIHLDPLRILHLHCFHRANVDLKVPHREQQSWWRDLCWKFNRCQMLVIKYRTLTSWKYIIYIRSCKLDIYCSEGERIIMADQDCTPLVSKGIRLPNTISNCAKLNSNSYRCKLGEENKAGNVGLNSGDRKYLEKEKTCWCLQISRHDSTHGRRKHIGNNQISRHDFKHVNNQPSRRRTW